MTRDDLHVLTSAEMGASDRAAIAAGTPGTALMEAAGWQVARLIRRNFPRRAVVVLCGPGNNGGDGFVAARLLRRWGWPVRLGLLGDAALLCGDAEIMAKRWQGPIRPADPALLAGNPLVVDALFGAGLARPLEGMALELVREIGRRGLDVVAVDLPSGVKGDSGEILGAAPKAVLTVTFAALKPAHLLLPGRDLCGRIEVTEIGVTPLPSATYRNSPELWFAHMPRLAADSHKFSRGHLLVAGGAELTGAARLAVWAGRRVGAGLATVAAPPGLEDVYRRDHPGTMVRPVSTWANLLADPRVTAAVIGPGLGVGELTRRLILQALAAGKACVLDADGLTSFASDPGLLWSARGTPVLTPHEGEFARLFKQQGDRLARARLAAHESGAVVLLKGSDTVVASPDGRAAIAGNAPPDLATAGAGDVLSGLIGGLLAQGMDRFFAAAAAVWLHGEAARRFGRGLVAEDLIDYLPQVLEDLWDEHG